MEESTVNKTLVLTVVAALPLAGGCAAHPKAAPPPSTQAPSASASPTSTQPYNLRLPGLPDGVVLTTAGSGDATTREFTVGPNWRFSYAYAPCKNAVFDVSGKPSNARSNDGQEIELTRATSFARIGSVSQHHQGTYTLKISSTCKWAVTITNGGSHTTKPTPTATPSATPSTPAPAPTPTATQSGPPVPPHVPTN
jgi:hypothetical protein